MRSVLAVIVLAGCAGKTPPVVHYDLAGPPDSAAEPARPNAPVIALERIEAAAAYDSNRIALRTSDVRLDYYRYHRWIAPAPDQATELIAATWRESGHFSRVEVASLGSDAAAIVEGRLLALEVDASQPMPAVHIILELTARVPGEGVIYHRQFSHRAPLRDRSKEAAVEGMRRGLEAIARSAAAPISRAAALAAREDEPRA